MVPKGHLSVILWLLLVLGSGGSGKVKMWPRMGLVYIYIYTKLQKKVFTQSIFSLEVIWNGGRVRKIFHTQKKFSSWNSWFWDNLFFFFFLFNLRWAKLYVSLIVSMFMWNLRRSLQLWPSTENNTFLTCSHKSHRSIALSFSAFIACQFVQVGLRTIKPPASSAWWRPSWGKKESKHSSY